MLPESGFPVSQVDDRTFQEEVLAAPVPVLVGILATWCSPCRAMDSMLHRLAREMGRRLKVVLLDADDARETAQDLRVEGVPTCLLLRSGQVADRIAGLQPYEVLRERVDRQIA